VKFPGTGIVNNETREQIIDALHKIEQARADRIEVWRQVVEADGTLAERIYRGSFQLPRDPQHRGPHSGG
jgi:hypothetical protein